MKGANSCPAFDPARLAVPTTLSDLPTIPNKVDLDRTLPMEPVVLAQLCAQTQISERRRVLPRSLEYSLHVLPGVDLPQLVAPPVVKAADPGVGLAAVRRRQTILLIVGPLLGMGLGMTLAWQLGLGRPRVAPPAAVVGFAPRVSSEPRAGAVAPPVQNVAPSILVTTPEAVGAAAPGVVGTPAPGVAGAAAPGVGGATAPGVGGAMAPGVVGATAPGAVGVAASGVGGGAVPGGVGGAAPGGVGGAAPGVVALAMLAPAAVTPASMVAGPPSGAAAGAASVVLPPAAGWEPLLVVAPSRKSAHAYRAGATHVPPAGARKLSAPRPDNMLPGAGPAAVASEEREAELPAAELPPGAATALPAARPAASATRPAVVLDAARKPTLLADAVQPKLDAARKPTLLADAVPPKLPAMLRQLYRHESVVGTYRICVQPSGRVASVTPVAGIPFDDTIQSTLLGWRFAPRATPACLDQELRFEVE